jgi:hypothetical protein
MLSRHIRKILQELIEGVAAFDVVEQRLHRHTCPGEERRPR